MAWTVIPDGDVDADSPVDEDLMGDLKDNVTYNFESGMRGGTFAVPNRLAYARGAALFSGATDGNGDAIITLSGIVFSSAASDGNPNFIPGVPLITGSLIEDSTTGSNQTWTKKGMIVSWFIEDGSLDETGFTVSVSVWNGANSTNIGGTFYWQAVAAASAGE